MTTTAVRPSIRVGNVYNLSPGTGLSWLVVSVHPSKPDWMLVVPVDSISFMVGPMDTIHPSETHVARCGGAVWLSRRKLVDADCQGSSDEWKALATQCRFTFRAAVERGLFKKATIGRGYAEMMENVRSVGRNVETMYG